MGTCKELWSHVFWLLSVGVIFQKDLLRGIETVHRFAANLAFLAWFLISGSSRAHIALRQDARECNYRQNDQSPQPVP